MSKNANLIQGEMCSKVDYIFSNSFNHTQHAYIDIAEDLVAGTLLSQIMYWFSLDKNKNSKTRIFKDGNYWIAKGREDWFEEIRISPKQYDNAVKKLRDKGLIETKLYKFNAVPTTHIRPIFTEINAKINEWKQKIESEILNENESEIYIPENPNLPNGENGNSQYVNMEVSQTVNSLTEITNKDYNSNSKANSFFAKKVRENKNKSRIDQSELEERISDVMIELREEVFSDDQADNVESFMLYFIDRYAEVFGKKHPLLKERTIDDIAAAVTECLCVEHENVEFNTYFDPLVSGEAGETYYEEIVDMYFETEFKQDIDYSMVHFSQKNVLVKLMGKATNKVWYQNS